jgi:hypothetical protein
LNVATCTCSQNLSRGAHEGFLSVKGFACFLLSRVSKSLDAMGRSNNGHGGVVNIEVVGVIDSFGCVGLGIVEVGRSV